VNLAFIAAFKAHTHQLDILRHFTDIGYIMWSPVLRIGRVCLFFGHFAWQALRIIRDELDIVHYHPLKNSKNHKGESKMSNFHTTLFVCVSVYIYIRIKYHRQNIYISNALEASNTQTFYLSHFTDIGYIYISNE
jgi:hypothetical protein